MLKIITVTLLVLSFSANSSESWIWESDKPSPQSITTLQCSIEPKQVKTLSAKTDGFIKELPLVNQHINAGDNVLVMGNPEIESNIKQTQNQYNIYQHALVYYSALLDAQQKGNTAKQEQLNTSFLVNKAKEEVVMTQESLNWLFSQEQQLTQSFGQDIVVRDVVANVGDYVELGDPIFYYFEPDNLLSKCLIEEELLPFFTTIDKPISVFNSETTKSYPLYQLFDSILINGRFYQSLFLTDDTLPVATTLPVSLSVGGSLVYNVPLNLANDSELWFIRENEESRKVMWDDYILFEGAGRLYFYGEPGTRVAIKRIDKDSQ